ncbi:MAG: iron ABC transporter permease [Candidatus Hydrogenedentes bacterium]|nr:iron ABC transporter permease [Candidatus Hydrogenedentota bacterium]
MPGAARHDTRRLDRPLLALCLLVLAITVLYPSLRLLVDALRGWDWAAITEGAGYAAIRNTLFISLASVLLAALVGVPMAYFLTHYSFPGRGLLAALAYLPFTLPPLVGVLSFYYIIGRDGFIPRFLEHALGWEHVAIPGPWAILLVHTYSFYVFFYSMAGPAFETLDRSQIEAARTLGASRARIWLRVILPALRPALLGASLLTFMTSTASFSAPYFFGQDFPMLSVQIFNERSQYNNDAALSLTLVLAAISLLGVALFRGRTRHGHSASKGVRVPIVSTPGKLFSGAIAWFTIVLLLIPHLTILYLSFIRYEAWSTEIIPRVFTLGNYSALFASRDAWLPLINSVWMSALATAATCLAGLPAAYLIARKRPGGKLVGLLVMLPWALPGTVIAMNLIVAFNERWLPLYGTVWLLPLAYFIRSIPMFTRMAGAAIEPFDGRLVEAGRCLGATKAYCFWRIMLPLLAPAVISALALIFATCLGEFVSSILIYTAQNLPISVRINMAWRSAIGPAFAYSVVLMAAVTATFILSRRFISQNP